MEPSPPPATSLRHLLEGYPFRIGADRYVVAGIHLAAAVLVVQFKQMPRQPLSIELPLGFDPNLAEHRAWLLYNIEQALARAAADAAAERRHRSVG